MKYAQCTLEKSNKDSSLSRIVSYIPEKFAEVGQIVKLKDENSQWQNGYVVKSVGELIDEEFLPDRHQEIKAHRRATGDSLRTQRRDND